MNDKQRKFMVRLVCIILVALMVLGGSIAAISTIIGG